MDDASFRQVLRFFALSWDGYRRVRKGVKKRLAQHMQELGQRRVGDYLDLLGRDPAAAGEARTLLTVSISRFFRDRFLWENLEQRVLPELLHRAALVGRKRVRAWSAGCASGEECYSLKILWEQGHRRFPGRPDLELWATDRNPEVLERARAGVYPESSLGSLPPVTLDEFFQPHPQGFAVAGPIKAGIHWILHDFVVEEPPDFPFDLILLRNSLLTYTEPPIQKLVLDKMLQGLRSGGFLVIGNNERLPVEVGTLRRLPFHRCIHEKPGPFPGEGWKESSQAMNISSRIVSTWTKDSSKVKAAADCHRQPHREGHEDEGLLSPRSTR